MEGPIAHARPHEGSQAQGRPPPPPPRPLIGDQHRLPRARRTALPYARLNAGYIDAILAAGGLPVLLPPLRKDNLAEIDALLDQLRRDHPHRRRGHGPARNGQALTAAVQPDARPPRGRRPLPAGRRSSSGKTPVLGIGVGMQQLNVFAGGTLHLHLPTDNPKAMPHFDQTGAPHRHMVLIEPNTRLDDIYGAQELRVNSTHHQAVNQIGKRMRVAAKAPDGVIEAIESTDPNWFCVGVQWHPEADTASALDVQIFECFVQAAVRTADGVLAAA